MKKALITIGSIVATVVIPVATVVSCNKATTTTTAKKGDTPVITESKKDLAIDKFFNLKSLKNLSATNPKTLMAIEKTLGFKAATKKTKADLDLELISDQLFNLKK